MPYFSFIATLFYFNFLSLGRYSGKYPKGYGYVQGSEVENTTIGKKTKSTE